MGNGVMGPQNRDSMNQVTANFKRIERPFILAKYIPVLPSILYTAMKKLKNWPFVEFLQRGADSLLRRNSH